MALIVRITPTVSIPGVASSTNQNNVTIFADVYLRAADTGFDTPVPGARVAVTLLILGSNQRSTYGNLTTNNNGTVIVNLELPVGKYGCFAEAL